MSEQYIKSVVEAALLAAGRSLGLDELAQLFNDGERPPSTEIRAALAALEQDFSGRAIELRETASGVRVQVRREFASEVSRLWPERPQRYSRALLETLSLIAYRQPITRAEIEAVRGVAVNPNIIRTLLERNWVRVLGHREVPGRPELLGTTREFLDYFGLRTLSELPPLAELRGLEAITPQLNLPVGLNEEGLDDSAASVVATETLVIEYEADPDDEAGDAPEVSAAPGMVASGPDPAD